MADAETAATLDVWRAEILARQGRGDDALKVYQGLSATDAAGAALALDARADFDRQRPFRGGRTALDPCAEPGEAGLFWIEQRAMRLLAAPGAGPA